MIHCHAERLCLLTVLAINELTQLSRLASEHIQIMITFNVTAVYLSMTLLLSAGVRWRTRRD
jgi:ABC-type amino acid transport system permease subunit